MILFFLLFPRFSCLFMFIFAFVFVFFSFFLFATFVVSFLPSFLLSSPVPFIFYLSAFFLSFFQILTPHCHEPFPSLPFNNATLLSSVRNLQFADYLCFSIIRYVDEDSLIFCRYISRGCSLHRGTIGHGASQPRHGKHRGQWLDSGRQALPSR